MSTDYRCTNCHGQLQATRKTYYSLVEGIYTATGQGDDFVFYCDNDCFEHETGGVIDLFAPDDMLPDLVKLGFAEKGEPWE